MIFHQRFSLKLFCHIETVSYILRGQDDFRGPLVTTMDMKVSHVVFKDMRDSRGIDKAS